MEVLEDILWTQAHSKALELHVKVRETAVIPAETLVQNGTAGDNGTLHQLVLGFLVVRDIYIMIYIRPVFSARQD